MSDGGVGTDIGARGANQRGQFRPAELAVQTHDIVVAPDFVEISAIACGAADDRAEAALAQRRSELAPAFGSPAFIGEHRRGMHHGIGLCRRQCRPNRTGRTDDLGMRGNTEHIGKTQNFENAVPSALADIRAAERKAFDAGGKANRFDRAGALPSGDSGEERRPVTSLRR